RRVGARGSGGRGAARRTDRGRSPAPSGLARMAPGQGARTGALGGLRAWGPGGDAVAMSRTYGGSHRGPSTRVHAVVFSKSSTRPGHMAGSVEDTHGAGCLPRRRPTTVAQHFRRNWDFITSSALPLYDDASASHLTIAPMTA